MPIKLDAATVVVVVVAVAVERMQIIDDDGDQLVVVLYHTMELKIPFVFVVFVYSSCKGFCCTSVAIRALDVNYLFVGNFVVPYRYDVL